MLRDRGRTGPVHGVGDRNIVRVRGGGSVRIRVGVRWPLTGAVIGSRDSNPNADPSPALREAPSFRSFRSKEARFRRPDR
jgi:hypothetical protein